MSTRYDVILPNGKRMPVYWHANQSKMEIVRDMLLPRWEAYCLRHWMGAKEQGATEAQIKRFLDGCACILLRDDPGDALTSYKEMMIGSKEISASSCPAVIAERIEGGASHTSRAQTEDEWLRFETMLEALDAKVAPYRKKAASQARRKDTCFARLEAIRQKHPGCKMETCRVDVDGCFACGGKRYRVDSTRGKYAPHRTRYGEQYDMDKIIGICCPDGGVCFADQSGYPVADEMITA